MNDEITIISYNIWFDTTLYIERIAALMEKIILIKPDVICLQEVRPEIYDLLIHNLDSYKYRFPKKLTKSYGCVTFSKYPITKCLNYEYPNSSMGRSLNIVKIEYPYKKIEENGKEFYIDKIDIVIANSHFESVFKKNMINEVKLKQYEMAATTLNKLYDTFQNVILCSDTNIMEHEEEQFDEVFKNTLWQDLWKIKGTDSNKYTYDSYENIHLVSKLPKFNCRSRIDRILYKTNNCIAKEFNILKADNGHIEPSDHFGVYGKFIIQKN